MLHFHTVIYPPLKPLLMSYLSVDCDGAAERLQVFNRKSGVLISHKRVVNNKFAVFLNSTESVQSNLMCVMLDDDGEFNAAIADNVQPILVDLITFDPTNPLPYEPPAA